MVRAEQARRRRENTVARWTLTEQRTASPADEPDKDADDNLVLLFLCCHPALPPAGQIALTFTRGRWLR